MKKWIIGIAILAVLGAVGYEVGMNYVSEKMINQVAEQVLTKDEVNQLLEDPAIQQTIKEQVGTEALAKLQEQIDMPSGEQTAPSNSNPSAGSSGTTSTVESGSDPAQESSPAFASKEEALKFLLGKFTMEELKGFAGQAQGGLTAEEKASIKSELLSRISPEEFQALKVLGLIELSKGTIAQ